MLYPINTPSRMVFDLNGVWQFALRTPEEPDTAPLCRPPAHAGARRLPAPAPVEVNSKF